MKINKLFFILLVMCSVISLFGNVSASGLHQLSCEQYMQFTNSQFNLCDSPDEMGRFEPPEIYYIEPNSMQNIKLDFEPNYFNNTKVENHFTPKQPFTAYDVIQINGSVPKIDLMSNTQSNAPITGNVIMTPPPRFAIPHWFLTLEDTNGKQYGSNEMWWNQWYNHIDVYSNDCENYHCTSMEFNGSATFRLVDILNETELEDFIKAVADGKKFNFVLKVLDSDSDDGMSDAGFTYYYGYDYREANWSALETINPVKIPISFTNCVQVYGNGKEHWVSMRGTSSGSSVYNLIANSDDMVSFATDNLYSSFYDNLSIYADLKNINDSGVKLINGNFPSNFNPIKLSSCSVDSYIFEHKLLSFNLAPSCLRSLNPPVSVNTNTLSKIDLTNNPSTPNDVSIYTSNINSVLNKDTEVADIADLIINFRNKFIIKVNPKFNIGIQSFKIFDTQGGQSSMTGLGANCNF